MMGRRSSIVRVVAVVLGLTTVVPVQTVAVGVEHSSDGVMKSASLGRAVTGVHEGIAGRFVRASWATRGPILAQVPPSEPPLDVVLPMVPFGVSRTGSSTVVGQRVRFPFTGSIGQRVFVYAEYAARENLWLQDPLGREVREVGGTWTTGSNTLWRQLSMEGQYAVVFEPPSQTTGSATVTVWDSPGVDLALATDGTASVGTTSIPGQDLRFTFDATAGAQVSVRSSTGLGTIDYTLRDPAGHILDRFGGSPRFRDPIGLPLTGRYEIVADLPGTTTGSVTMQVWVLPQPPLQPLPLDGTVRQASMVVPGQELRFSFSGTIGQRIQLKYSFPGSTFPQFTAPTITVREPSMRQIVRWLDTGSPAVAAEPFVLPTSGAYQVVVDFPSDLVGSVTIQGWVIATDVVTPAAVGGGTLSASITSPGQVLRFPFTASAGQIIDVRLSGAGTTGVRAFLIDGTGRDVGLYCCPVTPFVNSVTIPRTGAYQVVVDFDADILGGATVQLTANGSGSAASPDTTGTVTVDGPSVTLSHSPTQNAVFSFSGTAGQRIVINETSTALLPALSVVAPHGNVTTLNYTQQKGWPIGLGLTGTYLVRMKDFYNLYSGPVTLQVLQVVDPPSVTATVGGAPVTVTNGAPWKDVTVSFAGTAGQRVTFSLGPSTSTGLTGVYGPDGAKLWPVWNSGGLRTDTIALPQSGTYRALYDFGELVEATTLKVWNTGSDISTSLTIGGPAQSASSSVAGRDFDFMFNAVQGQRLAARVMRTDSNVYFQDIELFAPTGRQILDMIPNGNLVQIDSVGLAEGGPYRLHVDPGSDVDDPGISTAPYTFSAQVWSLGADESAELAFGQTRTLSNLTPYRDVFFTLQSSVSGSVTLQVSSTAGATISIVRPDGRKLYSGIASTSLIPVTFPLSVVGQPYLIVGEFPGTATGSVTVKTPASGTALPLAGRTWANTLGVLSKLSAKWLADPVNSATGAFTHEVVSLQRAARGIPFALLRVYDSRSTIDGVFGPGWGHLLDSKLAVDTGTGVASFVDTSGSTVPFTPAGGGTYTAPAGIVATMKDITGGREVRSADQIVRRFDTNGRMTAVVDRSGQGLVLAYNGAGEIATVTDASGGTFTFTYGTTGPGTGKLTGISASDGRSVGFGYTTLSTGVRLTSFTDERLKTWAYTYSPAGLLVSETDPLSHVGFYNVYDTIGRVVDQADAMGKHSAFVWDDANEKVTMTDATGAIQVHDYTGLALAGTTTPAGSSVSTYNAAFDLTAYQDENGVAWTATYDARGNMMSRTAPSPLAYVESWGTYDAFNNPSSYTNARGITTSYTYDTSGRLLTESTPGPNATTAVNTYTWNTDGTIATARNARNLTTTYTYTTLGQVASVTDATGGKTTYTYDTAGRVATVVEPRGNASGGNPANYRTSYIYDADGHVLTVTDALGRPTTSMYDDAGNLATINIPATGITSYGYNAANELTSVTAPDAGVRTFSYSDRGERVSETDPTGGVTTFGYDGGGPVDVDGRATRERVGWESEPVPVGVRLRRCRA